MLLCVEEHSVNNSESDEKSGVYLALTFKEHKPDTGLRLKACGYDSLDRRASTDAGKHLGSLKVLILLQPAML
jgi:hypothetical protein